MATSTRQFPTPTLISGSKRQLTTAGVATASNTKATQAALALATLTIQWTPEATTAAAATIPATAAVAWNNIGWETASALDSLSDGGTTRAATVPVILSLTASTAGSVTSTVILYANGVEIGRGSATTAIATAATVSTVNVAVTAGVAFAAGAKLQMAVYSVLPTNASLGAITYTFNYGTSTTTGTNIAPVTYSISATRSASESASTTDSAARSDSVARNGSVNDMDWEADSAQRSPAYARAGSDSLPAAADTASRSAAHPRIASESTGSTDSGLRTTGTVRRTANDFETEVDTAFRAITKNITATDVAPTGSQSAQKIITFGRGAREYFTPTDLPITVPTKRIGGTVYLRATGARYLGGATVTLVRDDGLECGTTVSSTVDGTYSFIRDAFDTFTYSTRIKREVVSGQVEEAISQSGLVPT